MSSNTETMKTKSKRTLTPKLRFPEFRDKGEWKEKNLAMLTEPVTDRVGDLDCVPYTVTSGEGLISQEEKYGRTIAGKSLKNYYRLKRDDFAFNKSATKSFPQGYIARFQKNERAAVPNSIFTCFRIADANIDATYLDYLFQGNLHGRWLKDYITVGARAHGALNISDDDLYALPIPLPAGDEIKAEQQKIADCLGSLDRLIGAEGRKLVTLREHKRGLMQQLFPQPGQTQPRLRFPEFRDKGEWEEKPLKAFFPFIRNGFVGTATPYYTDDGIPYLQGKNIKSGRIDRNNIVKISKDFHEKQKKSQLQINDILMVQSGHVGECALVDEAYASANCHALIILSSETSPCPDFFLQLFYSEYGKDKIAEITTGNTVKHILASGVKALKLSVPILEERERISACLTALDDRIAAQAAKIDKLKQHKRGLMQQLFPAPEEQ